MSRALERVAERKFVRDRHDRLQLMRKSLGLLPTIEVDARSPDFVNIRFA